MSNAKVFGPLQKKAQKPVKGAAEGPVASPLLKVRPFAEAEVEVESGKQRDLFGEYLQRRKVAAATEGGGALGPGRIGEGGENRTGLPDRLKAGLEGLSGQDLSEVRVHYGSAKPAQLGAHAYAQGREIHLGPGQHKHLPHEGWHVVQQAQGRVRPTVQAHGAKINDDVGMEREADLMGAKALEMRSADPFVAWAAQGSIGGASGKKVSEPVSVQMKAEEPVKGAAEGQAVSPHWEVLPFVEDVVEVEVESGEQRDLFGKYVQRRNLIVSGAAEGQPMPGVIQLASETVREQFYALKGRYQDELDPSCMAGKPAKTYKVTLAEKSALWNDIYSAYQVNREFNEAELAALNQRITDLMPLIQSELGAAQKIQLDFEALENSDVMKDMPDVYEAKKRYDAFVAAYNGYIATGEVANNEQTLLGTLEWIKGHTADRDYDKESLDEALSIDSRQWQQYLVDVETALQGDNKAPALEIFRAFNDLDPGWLGGKDVARLLAVLQDAIENLEYAGWTQELEDSKQDLFGAFIEQSQDEKQDARNAQLDLEAQQLQEEAQIAADAAANLAVLAARPQLPGTFSGVGWSFWNGDNAAGGFQIPKSFQLRSNSGTIAVYFQPNQDVTAKHLKEYLQREHNAGRAATGVQALTYLMDMQGEFDQLTDGRINSNTRERPNNWEFLFKDDENGLANHRTCYHSVPRSGPYHT